MMAHSVQLPGVRRAVAGVVCGSALFGAVVAAVPVAAQSSGTSRVEVNNGWESVDVGLPMLVEDVAEVTLPVGVDGDVLPGRHPVVVLLHGQHRPCFPGPVPVTGTPTWCWPGDTAPVPSFQGYRYVADALARDGRIVVSVSADGINAQANVNSAVEMSARGSLIEHHLQSLANANAGLTYDGALKGKVDLSDVVLMGHSRGGEGVMHAAQQINRLARPEFTVGGVMNFAPVNNSFQAVGSVPVANVLPACDGDVFYLAGQSYVDRSRDLYGTSSQLQSSVWIPGGNHNYLNTEWTPGLSVSDTGKDDATQVYEVDGTDNGSCAQDQRLTPAVERAAGRAYLTEFARMVQDGDRDAAAYFDGTGVVPGPVARAQVAARSSSVGGADRFILVPTPETNVRSRGAQSGICQGAAAPDPDGSVCWSGVTTSTQATAWLGPTWAPGLPNRYAVHTTWKKPGTTWVSLPHVTDLSAASRVNARVVLDPSSSGTVRLAVRDRSGAVMELPRSGPAVRPVSDGDLALRLWPQTTWASLSEVTGVDLAHITDIGLMHTGAGTAWLIDASARFGNRPTPPHLLPTASVSDVFRALQPGPATLTIPVRLDAPTREGATFAYTITPNGGSNAITGTTGIVNVGPGSRNTVIPVTVDMPEASGQGQTRGALVRIYSLSGASVADTEATVTVVPSGGVVRTAQVVTAHTSADPGGALMWTVAVSDDTAPDEINFYGSLVSTTFNEDTINVEDSAGDFYAEQREDFESGAVIMLPSRRTAPGLYDIILPLSTTATPGASIEMSLYMDGAYLPGTIDLTGTVK